MGIELEPVLAQVYAKRTGYKVRRVNAVLQHPEQPFMLANLDREVVGHPDGPGILEIKTASYHSAPSGKKGCRWLTSVRYSINWPSPAMPGPKWLC